MADCGLGCLPRSMGSPALPTAWPVRSLACRPGMWPHPADELPADIAAEVEESRRALDLPEGVDYEKTMEVGGCCIRCRQCGVAFTGLLLSWWRQCV